MAAASLAAALPPTLARAFVSKSPAPILESRLHAIPHAPRLSRFSLRTRHKPSLPLSQRIIQATPWPRRAMRAAVEAPTVEEVAEPQIGERLPAGYEQQDPYKLVPPRRAGILLHPTSLPGPHGIGDLGSGAIAFLDWLQSTGCTIWQVLPLVPPGRKSGEDGSPYAGQDANCGNTLLLSLDQLVEDGLLLPSDVPAALPVDRVDFEAVAQIKDPLVSKAARALVQSEGPLKAELRAFIQDPDISSWLQEAALFAAIDKDTDAEFWWQWPVPLRDRHPDAMEHVRRTQKDFIDEFEAKQFLFQRQWQAVLAAARRRGIAIMGDMPIYVGGHSADVWANRQFFMLDPASGHPTFVSGVPPDAFSDDGQLWGSPLYDWAAMARDGYGWWVRRMRRAAQLYDEFRIDHFRGLAGYWCILADASSAKQGYWLMGPRKAFFDAIKAALGRPIPIVAEDLGVITVDVVELRRQIDAPGMAVLQFAFGSDSNNPHLPHNHELNQVVYPGTHDNDTVVGWWQRIPEWEKEKVRTLLGLSDSPQQQRQQIHWHMIRAAVASVARTTVVALQDVMGLDNNARMNTPAVKAGQWGWRAGDEQLYARLAPEARRLRQLLADFNRAPPLPSPPPPAAPEPTAAAASDEASASSS